MLHITNAVTYTSETESLYNSAFPPEERYLPFKETVEQFSGGRGELLVFADGDQFVGFVMTLPHPKLAYLYYFAIHPDLRSHGYGSQALTLIRDYYAGLPIAFSVEPEDEDAENLAQRLKRKDFYRRNGFHDTELFVGYNDCRFQIMSSGETPSQKIMDDLLVRIDGMVTDGKLTMSMD